MPSEFSLAGEHSGQARALPVRASEISYVSHPGGSGRCRNHESWPDPDFSLGAFLKLENVS